MTLDFAGDADAIAALFPSLTPPAGLSAIRSATADPPSALKMLPAVVVYPDTGELVTGNSSRAGAIDYLARFYFAQSSDLPRQSRVLLKWLGVLVDVLKTSTQLGGRVARAVVEGFTVGLLPYAGRQYAGIELRIRVTTAEGWVATA